MGRETTTPARAPAFSAASRRRSSVTQDHWCVARARPASDSPSPTARSGYLGSASDLSSQGAQLGPWGRETREVPRWSTTRACPREVHAAPPQPAARDAGSCPVGDRLPDGAHGESQEPGTARGHSPETSPAPPCSVLARHAGPATRGCSWRGEGSTVRRMRTRREFPQVSRVARASRSRSAFLALGPPA